MNESDFIINTLRDWSNQFDGILLRYAYDSYSEYHIIEVRPENIRRGNDEYEEAETELWAKFSELYPTSDILICEPSNSNDMSNVLYDNSKESKDLYHNEEKLSDIKTILMCYQKDSWIIRYSQDNHRTYLNVGAMDLERISLTAA